MLKTKDLTEINKLLLKEEYQAEKVISIVRFSVFSLIFLEIFLVSIFTDDKLYDSLVIPFLIIAVFTAAMGFDILAFGAKRLYKFFNRFIKYGIITIDIIIANYMSYIVLRNMEFEPTGYWALALFSLAIGGILSVGSVFRYNTIACIYTGFLAIAAFLGLSMILGSYNYLWEIIIMSGRYKLENGMYLGSMLTMIILSSLFSYQIRKILIRSKRQEKLERFLPDVIAHEIINGERDLSIGGKKQNVTILFSDIRNFTSMSESLSPEETIDFLNTYFNDMIEVVFRYNGTLDKIMGDGIMALYGAPFTSGNDAENAVMTAVYMHKKLEDHNQIRKMNNLQPIQIGIGIHTGEVIMGNVGTEKRMDFTAIGDAVNTASRLENLTKDLNVPIIISKETRECLENNLKIEKLESVSVKGKRELMELYAVAV
jgi:class 3 adenylate cyclase